METSLLPHEIATLTTQQDYTCYPTLVPGDWYYEQLKVENPRKLKRLMKEEQQLYEETRQPEYQAQMRENDRNFAVELNIDLATGGKWSKRMAEMKNQMPASAPASQDCALLGLDAASNLTKREVRNAYRRKARKLHPDVGGDGEAFKQLYAAYRATLKVAAN